MLPNASHGPIALDFGGWVGGPVDATAAFGCGEAEGARAWMAGSSKGEGDEDDVWAMGVAEGAPATWVCCEGFAEAVAGGTQTWPNWTGGGTLPYPEL